MLIAILEDALHKSWLTGVVISPALQQPVLDARLVCRGGESYIRQLRQSLEATFNLWRAEKGTLPDDAHGGLLGNVYAGKALAECPPYACMGEWGADYVDLLAKLKCEQYPALIELEDMVSLPPQPITKLPNDVPVLPSWDTQSGMQQMLAALILSEAAAGNVNVATKAHRQLRRILDTNERLKNISLRAGQEVIHTLAITGAKFKRGRKVNTGGPIRKVVARELTKNPKMKNPELWVALAKRPPKGWEFCDNSLGQYADGPHGKTMSYARFCNVCGEERKKVRAKITG